MSVLIWSALYGALVLAPLAFAAAQGKPPRAFADELASGLGLVAFAILLVEFVLSGRFRTISDRLGLDRTMRAHQKLGRAALALALVHPFLYAAPFAEPMPWDPTRQASLHLPGAAGLTGLLAWLLLAALTLLAIFRDAIGWRYEVWRLTHGIGALVVAGAALHHALVAGRYSSEPALAAFWAGLTLLAAATLVQVYGIRPWLRRRRPYRVTRVTRVGDRIWELVLTAQGHEGMRFRAGQFVWLTLGSRVLTLAENPFSIASAPGERPVLRFLIKEAGDFTGTIGATAPGTPAYLDGPYGHLTLEGRASAGIALIGGGIGIAPMLAILRDALARGETRPIILVYGNRHAGQIVHGEELAAAVRPGLRIETVLSEPPPGWTGRTGTLDAACIRDLFGFEGARDWLYLLCGPPAMLDTVEAALRGLGVPPGRIVVERFRYD